MSKVIITADIHFGVPGKLDDIIYANECIREYAKAKNIDTILILGDLFHDRRYLEIDTLNAAYNFFKTAKSAYDQDWIVFPGNHDMFLKHSWEINSLAPLSDIMTVIQEPSSFILSGQKFWILPFISLEQSYMQALNKINDEAEENDILLTHIGVNGAILNTCFMLKDWGIVHFNNTKFKRIYTGHFHSTQEINGRVYYPGSPIPFKQDEGNVPHGFFVLDLETSEHRFIDIWQIGKKIFPGRKPPAQYCSIIDSDVENLNREDVQHNRVRIAITEDISPEKKKSIKEHLESLGAESVSWMIMKQDEATKMEDTHNETETIADLFEVYLKNDAKGTKSLNVELLRSLNEEIIKIGDDHYKYEEF